MAWPSTLTTFTDPLPTQKLNSPSHSSIEGDQNTAVEEVQAFVGTLSSVQGTLMYDIRAAASDGGGHIQAVNKGGTGQTAYINGDLLVASSASVLSKLAVGNDGEVLTADSSVSAGVKWVDANPDWQQLGEQILATNQSVLAVTIPARQDLRVIGFLSNGGGPTDARFRFNNDGGDNYGYLFYRNQSSSVLTSANPYIVADNNATTLPRMIILDIVNSSVVNKIVKSEYVELSSVQSNIGPAALSTGGAVWATTSMITKIEMRSIPSSSTLFGSGTRLTIYGKKD